jgi:diketogulonate reductase-like aldo/keto reductase
LSRTWIETILYQNIKSVEKNELVGKQVRFLFYKDPVILFERVVDDIRLDSPLLIHWPLPAKGKYKETWKAFEKLYKDGRIRAIGVSNFKPHHLEDLMADCEVNQLEKHQVQTMAF